MSARPAWWKHPLTRPIAGVLRLGQPTRSRAYRADGRARAGHAPRQKALFTSTVESAGAGGAPAVVRPNPPPVLPLCATPTTSQKLSDGRWAYVADNPVPIMPMRARRGADPDGMGLSALAATFKPIVANNRVGCRPEFALQMTEFHDSRVHLCHTAAQSWRCPKQRNSPGRCICAQLGLARIPHSREIARLAPKA